MIHARGLAELNKRMTGCNPMGSCCLNLICDRCDQCIAHCTCVPLKLRPAEIDIAKHKTRLRNRDARALRRERGRARI